MPNRISQFYNSILQEAPELRRFYTRDNVVQGMIYNGRYLSEDSIGMYYNLLGFELFGKREENRESVRKVMQSLTGTLYAGWSAFSVTILKNRNELGVYLGSNPDSMPAIMQQMRSSLSNCRIENRWIRAVILNSVQGHNTYIVGVTGLEMGDIDAVLSSAEYDDYAVFALAIPVESSLLESEITYINQCLEQLETVSRQNRRIGYRDFSHQNHVPNDIITLLSKEKEKLQKAIHRGAWQLMLAVSAADAKTAQGITEALIGQFRLSSSGTPVIAPRYIWGQNGVVNNNIWYYPSSFLGERPYGSGLYHNSALNIVDSEELSGIITFPTRSYHGYSVSFYGEGGARQDRFNRVVPQAAAPGSIHLGRMGTESFDIAPNDLRQHALISGTTQYGKSTTVRTILKGCSENDIPFIVIEASKKDYWRKLASQRGLEAVEVYSFGRDAKPLYFNPFIPEEGTIIRNHIDSLTISFLSLFYDVEGPVPLVLERLINYCYEQCGWQKNQRYSTGGALEFPTPKDLLDYLDTVVKEIGYGEEVTKDMTGAMRLRIGKVVDLLKDYCVPETNITTKHLLATSAIIELDDLHPMIKSFFAGIIALRLNEHVRTLDTTDQIRQVLVLEEAHALLPRVTPGVNNAVSQVSAYFSNMLAELSGYGTGMVVVDQRPTAISSDAIANSALKILHTHTGGDDRSVLGEALGLDNEIKALLGELDVGEVIMKLPKEKGTFRIHVDALENETTDWNIGYLFCDNKACISYDNAITKFEERYIRIHGVSVGSLQYCIDSICNRNPEKSYSADDKMRIAGELCLGTGINALRIRQILCDLWERMRGLVR